MPRKRRVLNNLINDPSSFISKNDIWKIGLVTDIILNQNHEEYEKQGTHSSIGTIFFTENNKQSQYSFPAKPLMPHLQKPPLLNEIVLICSLPNTNIGEVTSEFSYYYITPISIWNSSHANILPNPITFIGGEVELNSNSSSQQTFKERTNIHPLIPHVGDTLLQGRWGNSIRMSSTAKPKESGKLPSYQNNSWSESGENGDPITIIRNGQPKEDQGKGYEAIVEHLANDQSSIWLTSTQKVSFTPQNITYSSYDNEPTFPQDFINPQIVLNSDRLILNAKTDSVLISAEKTVFLGSNGSLNFNATDKIVVESSDIKLGNKKASEPVILGDKFLTQLEILLTAMETLCTALEASTIWPIGAPAPSPTEPIAAGLVKTEIAKFKAQMESFKSGTTKVI